MKNIGKIFETKYGGLFFSLLCGAAYYIIILDFLVRYSSGGGLLGFFFFPAIICGSALVIMKTVNKLKDEEKFSKINLFLYLHTALIAISIVFLIDIFKN